MKFMIIFWGAFLFFFCVPFPIFIYMMTEELTTEPRNSLAISYGYLGFSLLIWGYIIVFFVNNLFVKTFQQRSTIYSILRNGIPREAAVTRYQLIKYFPESNMNAIQIVLSFPNLRNTVIEHEMTFHDSKPQEKRFDVGKKVKVLLNPNISQEPYFILSDQKVAINASGIILRGIFVGLLIAYIVGLYYYFYMRDSFDFGWQFLTFMHPIIFSGVMTLIYVLVFQLIVGKFFKNKKDEKILFSGRNAKADIISVSQTGLTVNDQPEIMIQVGFKDFRGTEHIAVYKKIVTLLNLSSVPKHGNIEILYDENDPKKIMIPKIF
ncbi:MULTISPECIES: hypothetical protein [Chryseobacterium]|uniref:hypothetical protein n=1 Tax=Chryseobacterium TaxID=59732 RepID=UPI00055672D3|nr:MULTISPECIES: hypothetical protein [Chryseobacterium]ATN06192.1 hypothetical protein CRN76_12655 [Chryseobacterium indologenes]MBF6643303.1 hypothetical protein [Chryseobacterium indologenes]MBU3049292.1 hypothetical protein [Chryseobacterium indologenes]MEB4758861.1 hypothetical protein [Chryseobacterium indologenes]QIX81933.1 hypothetical protein FOB56_12135 [Chryseobacterium indologenes]